MRRAATLLGWLAFLGAAIACASYATRLHRIETERDTVTAFARFLVKNSDIGPINYGDLQGDEREAALRFLASCRPTAEACRNNLLDALQKTRDANRRLSEYQHTPSVSEK